MPSVSLVFLICSVMCGTFVECQSILQQISSGNNVCNNQKLFKDFELSEVPQFGAMCNGITIPQKSQREFLLENNIVPILCMGLYEASLKLCKLGSDDTLGIEIFPPKVDSFISLFKMLDDSNNFSSLDYFCSSTATNFTVKESLSNTTEFWWDVLYEQLNDNNTCISICHTSRNNKINPLCSFIVWANGVYKNGLKNELQSLDNAKEQNDILETFKSTNEGVEQTNLDKSVSSVVNNFRSFEPSGNNQHLEDSANFRLPKNPSAKVEGELGEEEFSKNTTTKLTGTILGVNVPPSSAQEIDQKIQEEEQMKPPSQEKSQVHITNIPDATPLTDIGAKPVKNDKPKKKHIKKKTPMGKVASSLPESGVNESSKINSGSGKPFLPESQAGNKASLKTAPDTNSKTEEAVESDPKTDEAKHTADETKSKTEEAKTEVDETKPKTDKTETKLDETKPEGDKTVDDSNFNEPAELAITEAPLETEKNLNTYQDAPDEDEDGDDLEVDPDDPVKPTPNKTGPSKSGPPINNRVVGQPVDDQEIIIQDGFIEAEDSHFFTYFLCMAVLTIMAYLAFHNKKKLVALAVEGRRSRGTRRRPNSSNYSKLDCSLEEAMVSNTTASVTHVLY